MKKFMLKIFISIFLLTGFSVTQAQSQIITATGEYYFIVGMDDNFAEERARADAKRNAVEQTALHIQSSSKLKNYKLTHDEIIVFAAQILQITQEEISLETIDAKNKKFVVKIEAVADDSNLDLNKIFKNKQEFEENVQLYQKLNKLYEEQKNINENLKQSYKKNPAELATLKTQTQKNDTAFQIFSLMSQAVEFHQKENYSQAIELTEQVLEYDLSNSPLSVDNIYLFLGGCYGKIEKYDKSIEYFNKAYEINPGNETARQTMALEHLLAIKKCIQNKQYAQAVEESKICIQLDPSNETYKNLLGFSYFLLGIQNFEKENYEQSVENIQNALKIESFAADKRNLKLSYICLGSSYKKLGNNSEADKYFKLAETL